jgi:cysteine desulfurase family protein
MAEPKRTYLDNAATSWPKPEAVYAIVDRFQRQLGAPAGRSGYRQANEVERLVNEARRRAAELLGTDEPRRIVFTCNGTDALNLALHGLLRPGDHVITSVAEHNSVLRPLQHLQETRDVDVTHVPCDSSGLIDPDDVRRAIRPNTRLIALIHASNVTGVLQPVAAVGRVAHERGVLFLVDGAQSVGHVPINVRELGADLLAAAGHKGLLSPLGVGLLYIAPGLEEHLLPARQGGTGTESFQARQPSSLPDKYESGNHNVPGLLGLGAGVTFLQERTLHEARRHEQALTELLLAGLHAIPGVTVYGPRDPQQRVGVVSISAAGYDPQEFAMLLDTAYSIQVRAGLHCAPKMHQALGTIDTGGTVRFSLGPFNTREEIETTIQAVGELAASAPG